MPRNRSRILVLAGCIGLLGLEAALYASGMRQAATDPQVLLKEADRLAWLRDWGAAERLYAEAGNLFTSQGDKANALYSEVSVLRGSCSDSTARRLRAGSRNRSTLRRPVRSSEAFVDQAI